MLRILIDSRRKINSGIGRVSQWLAKNIGSSLDYNVKITHLITKMAESPDYCFSENEILETSVNPFSFEELYYLPELLSKHDFDLYINPQSTWSPFHVIPSINIIHDLWAIKNPEWLPSEHDLKARFKINNVDYFRHLAKWFYYEKASRYLTSHGLSQWKLAKQEGNSIWLGCWAQYAATTALSKKYVVVSSYIKDEVEKYFTYGNEAIVIHNTPKKFIEKISDNKKHFLNLSKLEERKNLDFLLDSYVIYADLAEFSPLPLIIAGRASPANRKCNK